MPTKFSSLNFLRATALAMSFVASMAVPALAQQTVDRPDEAHQSMLCTAAVMGNIELLTQTLSQLEELDALSVPNLAPTYPNIRCGEGGLTLLMEALYSNSRNRQAMAHHLLDAMFVAGILNESNGSGETELEVVKIMNEAVSPRYVRKMRELGAKTSCELSGECKYTGPDDWTRFTE